MSNVLNLYDADVGPNIAFLKSIKYLLDKYEYPFGDYDHTRFEIFKEIVEKEFSAVFSEENFTLTFTSEKKKELFLFRFS